jgi:arabinofuranosyltransferase
VTATTVRSVGDTQVLRRVALVGLFVFFWLLVRTAWLDDDAYITFRTVDNVLHGYGLRWNVLNRVQSYTHPLWMFAVTAVSAVTGEVYYASLLLSGAVSLAAVWLILRRVAGSVPLAVVALSMLLLSKAFVDYSTSGLENPLTHLLLVGFVLVQASVRQQTTALGLSTCLAALLMVNRFDTGLLVLPALAVAGWRVGVARGWKPVLLGLLPLVAWEIFSVVYYGFPFPNTAYSKLQHGVARHELIFQGFLYLLDSTANDPLTLLVIGAAVLSPAAVRSRLAIPTGIALYMAYVVWVGGDFMSGRFLTGPFVLAVMHLVAAPRPAEAPAGGTGWTVPLTAAALVWVVGLAAPRPTLASTAAYGTDIQPADVIAPTGITDERRYYYPQSGLLRVRRGVPMPDHKWLYMGLEARRQGEQVLMTDAAGFIGYAAGPRVYFVDEYGLGDPLVSRLPAMAPWRMGHFERHVPDGYLESIRTRKNAIADLQVAAYYEKLRIITEEPVWSRRRFSTILQMNLGRYDHLIRDYELVRATLDALSERKPDGSDWNMSGVTILSPRGVEVATPRRNGRVEIGVSGDDRYAVRFLRRGEVVSEVVTYPRSPASGHLETRVADAPRDEEFDAIRVVPSGGDGRYSLGHLRWARQEAP